MEIKQRGMFLHREWDEDKNKDGLGAALGLINQLVGWGVKDTCKSSFLLKTIWREEGVRPLGCVSVENNLFCVSTSIMSK